MSTVDERQRKSIRAFDFRRPNKLNRDHVRTLEIVQETFARQFTTVLSSTLRAVSSVTLESVEQLTYDEFVRATPNPTHLELLSIAPLPGVAIFQMPIGLCMTSIDFMLGGPGKPSDADRPLTDIENTLFKGLAERVLSELKYAFNSVVDFDPTIVQIESNPQFAQVAAPSDMVVVTTLDVRIHTTLGKATLCFPYASLTPVLDSFTGNVVVMERDPVVLQRAQEALEDRIHDAPTAVCVRFNPVRLTTGELNGLRIGDVVPLGQNVHAPLTVLVGGVPLFLSRPARRGKRLACQVLAPIAEV